MTVAGYVLFIVYGFTSLIVFGPTHYLVMSPPILPYCHSVSMWQ